MTRARNYSNQSVHYRTKTKKANRKTEKRNCLCCGKPFDSEGIHNRVCDDCKSTSAWRSGSFDVVAMPSNTSRKGKSE